jgi:hypothetical protein
MVMIQHATIREHVLLESAPALVLDSRAMTAQHLHALMVMLQHATIREHVLLEFALAMLEVHLIVSNKQLIINIMVI